MAIAYINNHDKNLIKRLGFLKISHELVLRELLSEREDMDIEITKDDIKYYMDEFHNIILENNVVLMEIAEKYFGDSKYAFDLELDGEFNRLICKNLSAETVYSEEPILYVSQQNNRGAFNFTDEYVQLFPECLNGDLDEFGKAVLSTRNITFAITEQCNLRCTYCYQHNKRDVSMTKETAKKGVDMLFREREANSRYLNEKNSQAVIIEFIGGEPLLEAELMDFVMSYFLRKAAKERHRWAIHCMFSATTNGVLYEDESVKRMLAKYGEKLSFGITIDGNRELHDACRVTCSGKPTYDIVEKNMKNYLKLNPQANTKLTLAPANFIHVFEAIKNLYENVGLKYVFANVVFEEGWTEEHGVIFYQKLKQLADWMLNIKINGEFQCSLFEEELGYPLTDIENENWCGGTGNMMAITPDGLVSPCIRYTEYNLNHKQPALAIGNVDNGFESNEKEIETVDMLKSITRRSQSTDECYYCPIAKGCAWCSAHHYEIYGTPNKRATFICPMHKSRVLANVYYWNKFYKQVGIEKTFALHLPKDECLKFISEDEFNMLKDLSGGYEHEDR